MSRTHIRVSIKTIIKAFLEKSNFQSIFKGAYRIGKEKYWKHPVQAKVNPIECFITEVFQEAFEQLEITSIEATTALKGGDEIIFLKKNKEIKFDLIFLEENLKRLPEEFIRSTLKGIPEYFKLNSKMRILAELLKDNAKRKGDTLTLSNWCEHPHKLLTKFSKERSRKIVI